jgi:hypothetical protein
MRSAGDSRPRPDVMVVFSVEGERPEPLGAYVDSVEDLIRYRTLDNEVRQAPQDCVRVVSVNVDPTTIGLPRPVSLERLHATLRSLQDRIDDEANVPDRYQATAAGDLAESDAATLASAARVVHRLMVWDRHPNVWPARYFAPGRGHDQ